MSPSPQLFSIKLLLLLFSVSMLSMSESRAVDAGAAFAHSALRLAARDPSVVEAHCSPKPGNMVQDTNAAASNRDSRLEVFLALHCQAIAGVSLRESAGPYGSSACGDLPGWATPN